VLNNLLRHYNNKIENQSLNIQNSFKETLATEEEQIRTPNFSSQHKNLKEEYSSKSQQIESSPNFKKSLMNENENLSDNSDFKT